MSASGMTTMKFLAPPGGLDASGAPVHVLRHGAAADERDAARPDGRAGRRPLHFCPVDEIIDITRAAS
jgi:hypothetical protein